VSSLIALNQEIISCTRCPRLIAHCQKIGREKRKQFQTNKYWALPVPNFIPESSQFNRGLLVVGLAPSAHGGNRTGRMFTGDNSGLWLYRALHRAGFAKNTGFSDRADGQKLNDCLITTVAHCAPPANIPNQEEIANCQEYLLKSYELSQPSVIVALGAVAWANVAKLLSHNLDIPKIKFSHGAAYQITSSPTESEKQHINRKTNEADAKGFVGTSTAKTETSKASAFDTTELKLTVIGSYHPSQQNTFTKRLTEPMLDDIFSRARKVVDSKPSQKSARKQS
jgi:uracil-DNA glycosylase